MKKMNDKGKLMILVGYYSSGGYKLYDVENGRIMIRWDVIFDEIKQLQPPVIGYQKDVTDYNNEKSPYSS